MAAQPVIKKQKGISPLWTLPLLAIMICAWLLYKSFMEAGIEIEVYFDDASGIIPEKTHVISRGIPFGIVKDMTPDIEHGKVKVTIRMDRQTEPYLVEDTKLWLVKPEVSANRITGLETILVGSYIGIQRGQSTVHSRQFTAYKSAPPIPINTPGLHIKLKSKALRSIQEGSSIYFRNIKIGNVESYKLEPDESILIDCYILPEYQSLVRDGSRFYDASGITFSGQLTNLKIRMESIASLLVGGIVLSTPETLKSTPKAVNDDVFTLYEDFEAADYGIPMKLKLASGKGIAEGVTKVMYRGLEAGYVKHISFNDDKESSVSAHILLDPRADIILRENTKFWLVSPTISTSGINNIDTLLKGPYITFKPGDGEFKDQFEIMPDPPAEAPLRPGKTFLLTSADTVFQNSGAPIYYHKMQVGEIIGSKLSDDRNSVITTAFIYQNYSDLIRPQTVFIKTGGISINASFTGFSAQIDPLQTLLKGGIDIQNPNKKTTVPDQEIPENTLFPLYQDYETAIVERPALKPNGLYFTLNVDNLGSYRPGSPLLFKKIKVGQVIGFELDQQDETVMISCFIKKQYEHLVTDKSKFYRASGINIHGSLQGVSIEAESFESLMSGGIAFITDPDGKVVDDNVVFPIFDSLKDAQSDKKIEITVTFESGDQLNIGAPVKNHGIQIGAVSDIRFGGDLKSIVVKLQIEKMYETFFREHTKVWLTSPTFNLSGVKNLETVLFGSSLEIKPGTGDITHEFVGLDEAPQFIFPKNSGLNIVLETKHLGSIDISSPVYYRQVQIGKVTGYNLAADFKDVFIYISIDKDYSAIVRENTRFWNVSGIKVKGGIFSGITVSTESMQSLMVGGIALATPGKEDMGPPAYNGYHFRLHEEAQDKWTDWSPDVFVIEAEKPTE